MQLKLPKVILALLKQRGATMNKKLRATRAQVISTCKERGYPPHASVLAFEDAFGGLLIPDGPKLKKGEPVWLFGTYACLTEGGHEPGKVRKLVPVVNSPNDVIYYLDEKGRAYAEGTIEDTSASLYAEDKTSLVCRIVLHDALFSRDETSLDLPGLQGKDLSKRFTLKLIHEASGKDRRFFSNAKGDVIVVEDIKAKQTRFAGSTKKQLDLVRPPSKPVKVAPDLVQFLGKTNVRIVGEKRTSLPDFDQLPDLRELDVSINHLSTLPESLWRATQLTSLDIGFNPLETLPDGISNMKALRSLSLRGCPFKTLPDSLAGAKNLTRLILTEGVELDVDAALLVIAKLPKLKELWLPLSRSLTSLAPLAHLPLKSITLNGMYVQTPGRLPSGLGQLKQLTDLRIEYADSIAELPEAPEDVRPLRLLFSKKFTDDDIRKSVQKQPGKLYLQAYVKTL